MVVKPALVTHTQGTHWQTFTTEIMVA